MKDEEINSSRIISPPKISVNTSSSYNNSNQDKCINTSAVLDSQDQDILKILEELQSTLHNNMSSNCVYEPRIEVHKLRGTFFRVLYLT